MVINSVAGSGNTTYTYTDTSNPNPSRIAITNDGAANIVLTVNSLNITIKGGEGLVESFKPFTTFALTTTSSYRYLVGR